MAALKRELQVNPATSSRASRSRSSSSSCTGTTRRRRSRSAPWSSPRRSSPPTPLGRASSSWASWTQHRSWSRRPAWPPRARRCTSRWPGPTRGRPRGGRRSRARRVHAPPAGTAGPAAPLPALSERCDLKVVGRLLRARLGAALAHACRVDRPDGPRVLFTDVTEAAGLTWRIGKVAVLGGNLVETMGGGGASSTSTATGGWTSTRLLLDERSLVPGSPSGTLSSATTTTVRSPTSRRGRHRRPAAGMGSPSPTTTTTGGPTST